VQISKFGSSLTKNSGILQLMDDLGKALSTDKEVYMLGGGNPAHIAEVQKIFKNQMQKIIDSDEFNKMIGNYVTPQGDMKFLEKFVNFFNKQANSNAKKENVVMLNGSQTAFFFLFNLIAGEMPDGKMRKILFPMVPEYIGYADQGLSEDMFISAKPIIESIDENTFKYKIDFDAVDRILKSENISAICLSRPTNPTGNVATDEEIDKLNDICKKQNILLIIDNAYGSPFPGIIFTNSKLIWEDHIIQSFSLSKLGLPGTRSSLLVANNDIIKKLSAINAIISLASNTTGQYIIDSLIDDNQLIDMSNNIIMPYYKAKSDLAVKFIHSEFKKYKKVPYSLHVSEGALFLWLWCKDLPISSLELYNRLKKRNVIIVPGEYFFPGFKENWQHKQECIRINYSQDESIVKKGLEIIINEITNLY
jgi:valine--pyruvate aminotransferase